MIFKLHLIKGIVQFTSPLSRSLYETNKAYTEFCDEKYIGFGHKNDMLLASRRGIHVGKLEVRL